MTHYLKVLIADDHPVVREGLVRIVETDSAFEIVASIGDGDKALQLIGQKKPDIAVLDLSMPGMGGLEVIKAANERNYPVEYVVLTMFREEEFFDQAMDLGAKGYLLKESAVSDLVSCLHAVADGKFFVSPLVSDLFLSRLGHEGSRDANTSSLTEMEQKVIQMIGEHLTSKEIGERLDISYRTVQKHRTNICSKLNLQGYNSLYRFALHQKSTS